tara:strand:- start:107 stop:2950 length:2844 start_codon:yes stop_codon:yes gene_type:complete
MSGLLKYVPRRLVQAGLDESFSMHGDTSPPLVIEPTAPHTLTYIHMVGVGQRAGSANNKAVREDVEATFRDGLAPKLPGVRWVLPMAPRRTNAMCDKQLGKGLVIPAWANVYGTKFSSPQDWSGMCDSIRTLAELVRREVEERGVSPERIIVSGFSQGGCIALGYAIGQPASFARELGGELPDLEDPDDVARFAARLDAANVRVDEAPSDAPPWYRVGGVVVYRSFLPAARLIAHRDVGVGFVAPPLDAARAQGLPALFVTGSDDAMVTPQATVLSSRVLRRLGADVELQKLEGSVTHGDPRAEWCSSIGTWIAARVEALEEGGAASPAASSSEAPPPPIAPRDLHCSVWSRHGRFVGAYAANASSGAVLGCTTSSALEALDALSLSAAERGALVRRWLLALIELKEADLFVEVIQGAEYTVNEPLFLDAEGRSFLHRCAMLSYGYTASIMTTTLMILGADAHAVDTMGRTALQIAYDRLVDPAKTYSSGRVGASVFERIVVDPDWVPTRAEFELVQTQAVQTAIGGKRTKRGRATMYDLNCKVDRGAATWRWIQTSQPVLNAYILYAPPMLWYALFGILHPPFVFNRALCVTLIVIVTMAHYMTIITPATQVKKNPGPAQVATAYRMAGLERGAQSEGALTKYITQVGARLPVRYHWCKICSAAVLKRDHHCPWVRNCVGDGNALYFEIFITGVVVSCALLSHASAVWLMAHAPAVLGLGEAPASATRVFVDSALRLLLQLQSPFATPSAAASAAGWTLGAEQLPASNWQMLLFAVIGWFWLSSTVCGSAFCVASIFALKAWMNGYTAVEQFYMTRGKGKLAKLSAAVGGARSGSGRRGDMLSDASAERCVEASMTLAAMAGGRDALASLERGATTSEAREARRMANGAARTALEQQAALCRAVNAERYCGSGGVAAALLARAQNLLVMFKLKQRRAPPASRFREQ